QRPDAARSRGAHRLLGRVEREGRLILRDGRQLVHLVQTRELELERGEEELELTTLLRILGGEQQSHAGRRGDPIASLILALAPRSRVQELVSSRRRSGG